MSADPRTALFVPRSAVRGRGAGTWPTVRPASRLGRRRFSNGPAPAGRKEDPMKARSWLGALAVGLMVLCAAPARGQDGNDPEYGGKKLSAWVKQLQNGKGDDRQAAILAILEFEKEHAKQAVPALI